MNDLKWQISQKQQRAKVLVKEAITQAGTN